MSEEKIFFQSDGLHIEGLLRKSHGHKAVVVSHPHTLYGGDMYNDVVETIISAYQQTGYTTLRFNFRGVGHSEGMYDDGVGEQKDIQAALESLTKLGKTSIDLAGYSFGSWVSAMGLKTYEQVKSVVFVSPPVDFLDFSSLGYNPRIKLVITGSEDTYAPPQKIKEMLPTWNPKAEFRVIQGADHFYSLGTNEMDSMIKTFLNQQKPM